MNYKKGDNYKELVIKDDGISKAIDELYYNNVWNLNDKFKELQSYKEQIGEKYENVWMNKIQHLDIDSELKIKTYR